MSIVGSLIHFFMERRAKNSSFDELAQKLVDNGPILANQMAVATDTPANRAKAEHVIGIERWAQNRLKVALGNPLVIDEYTKYQPKNAKGFRELSSLFTKTRADTLKLVKQLKQADAGDMKVRHNDMGDITVKTWLYYLSAHAARELGKIKNKPAKKIIRA